MMNNNNYPVIYLDYHASTPLDPRVTAVMSPFFTEHFANPHAADHFEGWRAHDVVETAIMKIVANFGVDSDEIVFTSGATESNNLAILGLGRRAKSSRRRILVSAFEHKCVLSAASALIPYGFIVEIIPVNKDGIVDLDFINFRLKDDVLLVSVMLVNNEIGTIQPIAEIARLAHEVGAYIHTDAAQGLAIGPIDFNKLDVDIMSISGHKIYGPKGVGALIFRREMQRNIEPLMYGGGQQNGIRPGTLPVPLCIGLAEAVDLMRIEFTNGELDRIKALRDSLINGLKMIDNRIRVNGTMSERHPGNANIYFPDVDGHDLISAMQPRVAASVGSACTSGFPEPSHVLRAIGLSGKEVDNSIRFCVGRFTVEEEIEEAVALIKKTMEKLKSSI